MWESIRQKLSAVMLPLAAVPFAAMYMTNAASGKTALLLLFIFSMAYPPYFLWSLQGRPVKTKRSQGSTSGLELRPRAEISPNFSNWQGFLKRLIDITVSAGAMILLLPILLLIAIAIKIEGRGPILYSLKCLGRRRRPFTLLQFRIWEVDPHPEDSITRVLPPLTRTGALLERFALDRVPSLLNVLKGDMSLIGPKPQPRRDSYPRTGWANVLLEVRPGIVSLASVMADARQKALIREHQILWDIFYINHWSLTVDAKISWWLIKSTLTGRGDPPSADSLPAIGEHEVGESTPAPVV